MTVPSSWSEGAQRVAGSSSRDQSTPTTGRVKGAVSAMSTKEDGGRGLREINIAQ